MFPNSIPRGVRLIGSSAFLSRRPFGYYLPSPYVTATAHVKIFEAKIRSNLTWHSNMLQTKDLSKKADQKSEIAPAREDKKREDVESSP